jgi:AbrB family looped-hinge helix DNA binding protein
VKIKISSRGQIAIPARFRKKLKLQAGDELSIIESGDNLIISPPKETDQEYLEDLFNKLRGVWQDLDCDGVALVRSLRVGGTRDAW